MGQLWRRKELSGEPESQTMHKEQSECFPVLTCTQPRETWPGGTFPFYYWWCVTRGREVEVGDTTVGLLLLLWFLESVALVCLENLQITISHVAAMGAPDSGSQSGGWVWGWGAIPTTLWGASHPCTVPNVATRPPPQHEAGSGPFSILFLGKVQGLKY